MFEGAALQKREGICPQGGRVQGQHLSPAWYLSHRAEFRTHVWKGPKNCGQCQSDHIYSKDRLKNKHITDAVTKGSTQCSGTILESLLSEPT